MRVARKTTPCYCTECDAPRSLAVALRNPAVIEPLSFALCDMHARKLVSMLLQKLRTPTRPRTP